MFKQKRKPIDSTFIDFIIMTTPDIYLRIRQNAYAEFSKMSIFELKAIYLNTQETLEYMKPWDPAHAHFESICARIRQYIHYRYLLQQPKYREDNFAIFIPTNITKVRSHDEKDLNDALEIYGKDIFAYTFANRALIIIPNAGKNRSPELLEFLEVLHQFKLGEGASATDASFWKP